MRKNDKIYVSEYLKVLNDNIDGIVFHSGMYEKPCTKLSCKELSKRCGVTPATISNLTTSSKFQLLYRVASEILDAYFPYFSNDQKKALNDKDYADELVYPRDEYYVLMNLTTYYTDEWING